MEFSICTVSGEAGTENKIKKTEIVASVVENKKSKERSMGVGFPTLNQVAREGPQKKGKFK